MISYHFGLPIFGPDLTISTFFVLSGFLITWLLLTEYNAAGTISLRNFYTRRVLRIFPAYYCCIIVSFLIDHFRDHSWDPALQWSSFLYVVNYYNATHEHPLTSIAHAWSMGIEEQFYLLWPLILLGLVRRGTARALSILAVIIGAVAGWRSFLYLDLHVSPHYVYNAFDTRFDNLAVGCFLALCAGQLWFRRFIQAMVRSALLPLVTLGLLILSRSMAPPYHYSIGYSVDAVLIAVLLVQLMLLHRHPLWAWLEHPVVRYIGIISYPLYLWHVLARRVGQHLHMLPAAAQIMVAVALSIALASASYFLIEKPFLSLKKRFSPPTAPRQPRLMALQIPAASPERAEEPQPQSSVRGC